VFDNAEPADGFGFVRAALWPKQVMEVYGVPRSDITSVLVLRHNAIPFVMNDAYWAEYAAGKTAKLRDPASGKWATRNVVGSTPPGAPPMFADLNIPAFIGSGGIVLACYLAFEDLIATVGKKHKLEGAAAEAKAREYVLPGVIMQPSGFFAVLRAQQAGCGHMAAG
jgi:hypothetical protein